MSEKSREELMVILERDADGNPIVWCDPEIADLVSALNKAGIRTVASCSGHGRRPGNIMLADGRELVIARDFDEARKIDAMLPGINGEPPAVQGEPVAMVDASDDGMWAEILPDVTVKVGQILYAAPQPAEQQPAPDVAGLVEAAEAALGEIETIIQEAYNSAHPICCGRSGYECCGSPDPEWDEADQRMMDRLAPHQRALREALAAHRKQGGEV